MVVSMTVTMGKWPGSLMASVPYLANAPDNAADGWGFRLAATFLLLK